MRLQLNLEQWNKEQLNSLIIKYRTDCKTENNKYVWNNEIHLKQGTI